MASHPELVDNPQLAEVDVLAALAIEQNVLVSGNRALTDLGFLGGLREVGAVLALHFTLARVGLTP